MKIEQTLSLAAPPEKVWALLTDPYQVASCLPGAAIAEKVDDRTYLGTITVKVGPVTASYRGTVRFERLDPERWEAELVGQGQDTKGKGGAEMKMQSRLHPKDGCTEVWVASEVNISGILAQMGRGMIETIANQIFREFAAALEQKLAATGAAADKGTPAAAPEGRPLDALSLGAKAMRQAMGRAVRRLLGGWQAKD